MYDRVFVPVLENTWGNMKTTGSQNRIYSICLCGFKLHGCVKKKKKKSDFLYPLVPYVKLPFLCIWSITRRTRWWRLEDLKRFSFRDILLFVNNVLRLWSVRAIPTYRVYRHYDYNSERSEVSTRALLSFCMVSLGGIATYFLQGHCDLGSLSLHLERQTWISPTIQLITLSEQLWLESPWWYKE